MVRCLYTEEYQKRGFKCRNSKENRWYQCKCIRKDFERWRNSFPLKTLIEKRYRNKILEMVLKILGNGELTKKLTVQANAFSAGAVEKIEALGGKAEVI